MIGRTIAGRYKISTQLGEGGMGSVWRAQHLTLGSPVAIKLIDERIMGNTEVLARFEREAQAAANLRSPHVVQVLDYGVDDGTPFIAMELLDGESLEDRLARFGRLDTVETAMIMTHVGRAISKAHEAGITHRDLKPANIFLVRNDDEVVAKVLDFGVAKTQAPAGSATRTGHLIGTPAYMSPEQAQGNKSVDGRTDLWAMGAIAFECLLGRMVFEGDAMGDLILQICAKPLPVPSAIASVPEGFDDWFARALAREPDSRFQSAKELVDSLRQVLGVSPARSTASPTGPTLRGLGPDGDGAPPKSVRITPAGAIPVTGSDAESVASARTIAHGEPQPSLHREATAPKSSDAATQGTFTHGPDAIPTTSSPRRLGTALLGIAALAAVGIFAARRFTAGEGNAAAAASSLAENHGPAGPAAPATESGPPAAPAAVTSTAPTASLEASKPSPTDPSAAASPSPSASSAPAKLQPTKGQGGTTVRPPSASSNGTKPGAAAAGDDRVGF